MSSEIEIRQIGRDDNILRHVKGTQIANGRAESSAFTLDVEGGLSFGWIEYFFADFPDQVASVIREFCCVRTVRSSHRFAHLTLKDIRERFAEEGLDIPQATHVPVEGLSCHCEIGRQFLAARAAESILADLVRELYQR